MEEKDILIIVKTYPEISSKYTETVCTAGVLKDTKQFIRLYPVRYRYLEGETQFKKYQWISAKISKSLSDTRIESYNIKEDTIRLKEEIKPSQDWAEREKWVLADQNVYKSLEELNAAQEVKNVSLGIIKPKKILGFSIVKKTEKEMKEAVVKKDSVITQLDMFQENKDIEIIPYKFILNFACNDQNCKNDHNISILDWEFSELYRKMKKNSNWKKKIEEKVEEICSDKKETFLIMGNMAKRRHIFCVLGFFYPPARRNLLLFN